jgi:hypothetical protein
MLMTTEAQFLLPETTVTEKGNSEAIALGSAAGKVLLLTLGITEIAEQQSLDVAIYGSRDGQEWGEKPLRVFPQKFYRGIYSILCDLSQQPEIQFLRAGWNVQRWGVGSPTPMFRFYVFSEPFPER